MDRTEHIAGTAARIAIIGGGCSGTLALVHLVQLLAEHTAVEHSGIAGAITIDWFEPDTWCEGLAYRTTDATHLLNVRAARMGALAGRPEHLLTWLDTDAGQQALKQAGIHHTVTGDSYIPRCVYAAYLKSLLGDTLGLAKKLGITVHQHNTAVTDARLASHASLQLSFDEAGLPCCVEVNAIILATGNLPRRTPAFPCHFMPGSMLRQQRYVDDVWRPASQCHYPWRVDALPDDAQILIIGTGLTMVDTVMTLIHHGYRGYITAISRHGLLPHEQVHSLPWPFWLNGSNVRESLTAPHKRLSVLQVLQTLRREADTAMLNGHSWQSVFDTLRPITQTLWQQLDINGQRKFMARLMPFWGVHRHRMAPAIHARIRALQDSGRLQVLQGRVERVDEDHEGLRVSIHDRTQSTSNAMHRDIRPALLINCTGPEPDIEASDNILLKNMHARGLIMTHALHAGIDIDASGSATGIANGLLFPMGALTAGALLECTAVPEIREQASMIARRILAMLTAAQLSSRTATQLSNPLSSVALL